MEQTHRIDPSNEKTPVSTAKQEVLRYAPSPTGPLHSGNLSTALFTWIRSAQLEAKVLLRMDTLDPLRTRPEYSNAILETLKWAKLQFDGVPFFQDPGDNHYLIGLQRLMENELVYPCFCSRKSAYETSPQGDFYYRGTCSTLPSRESQSRMRQGVPHCWRFRVKNRRQNITDLAFGTIQIPPEQWGGDFVVWRKDNVPGYHLASVLDDIRLGISEINRGLDLLASSAAQLFLFDCFQAVVPRFFHFPLLVDPTHKKLSKRNQDSQPESLFRDIRHFHATWLSSMELNLENRCWGGLKFDELVQIAQLKTIAWRF